MITTIIGGVGLFLLGMLLLTEGLKTAAGAALNRILYRFTRHPLLGVFSGTLITTMVQSSSATTLATIGFVSAGMLSFNQALGVIYGINLGTTTTGWLVSLIGFKLNISLIALPLVALGALMRLLFSGRASTYGLVIAGFGLLFVGISTLQEGMTGFTEAFDPSRLALSGFWGTILLVLIGIAMTVVMQSSSAAVATTLVALHSGAIGLEQAAALVIGQNVGTTIKAVLASIGASVAAKRTALAHIVFNLVTGIVALALLPWLVRGMLFLQSQYNWDAATTMAAFHTVFNVVGVILFLPLTRPFARLIIALVREDGPMPTRHLNQKLIPTASAAIEAARRASLDVLTLVMKVSSEVLAQTTINRVQQQQLDRSEEALLETRRFLTNVRSETEGSAEHRRHISVLHAIDHIDRLVAACRENYQLSHLQRDRALSAVVTQLGRQLAEARSNLMTGGVEIVVPILESHSGSIAELRRSQRPKIIEDAATGQVDSERALQELEAVRWIDRLAYHSWRAALHLQENPSEDQQSSETVM